MTTITLSYAENSAFAQNMLKVLRSSEQFKVGKPFKSKNPSPSGDPYFDDPRNIEELERRIAERKNGKSEFIELTPEYRKKLFSL